MITLYDTTLRDGSQGEGISFSVEDKLKIARALDRLGIDFIEAGFPSSNPKDQEFFKRAKKLKLKHSELIAFGATVRSGVQPAKDQSLKDIITAGTKYVTIFGKSSDFQVKKVLRISLQENLNLIEKTIKYLVKKGKGVFYDAEHFFDGFLSNPQYSIKTLQLAQKAGTCSIILCDTNGGIMPWQISAIIKEVKNKVKLPLGIHCHNDSGVAIANSLIAVRAGCSQVQGTVNGLGERCGNADILTIIANLYLKMGIKTVSARQLKLLTHTSRLVYDILNLPPSRRKPYVGLNAFTHKGGMHIDGVAKTGGCGFEHIDPAQVGNERRILVSELAGRAAIVAKIKGFLPNLKIDKSSCEVIKIYQALKLKEQQGYQYEAAEASFALLAAKVLGRFKPHFQIKYYNVEVEGNDGNGLRAEAQIVITDPNQKEHFSKQSGNGPIDALAKAFYNALSKVYPQISKIKMIDYKIKVLNGIAGSSATARVWIEFRLGRTTWATVAVATNTTQASLEAIAEGLEYGLGFVMRD